MVLRRTGRYDRRRPGTGLVRFRRWLEPRPESVKLTAGERLARKWRDLGIRRDDDRTRAAPLDERLREQLLPRGVLGCQRLGGLTYFFEVTGPAGTTATLDVYASGAAAASATGGTANIGTATADANFYIANTNTNATLLTENVTQSQVVGQAAVAASTVLPEASITVQAGTVYAVWMSAYARVTGNNNGWNDTLAASASIDPFLAIDPATANASSYGLSVSQGVGNSTPVPIPGTWLLLSSALGLAGVVRAVPGRRRSGFPARGA